MRELHEMIRNLREDHDLKQKEVAEYLNISQQTYSGYENNRRQIPVWIVRELSKYYKASVDYLLGTAGNYPGNVNLDTVYYGRLTMRDVIYEMHKLKSKQHREVLDFIGYLRSRSRSL